MNRPHSYTYSRAHWYRQEDADRYMDAQDAKIADLKERISSMESQLAARDAKFAKTAASVAKTLAEANGAILDALSDGTRTVGTRASGTCTNGTDKEGA